MAASWFVIQIEGADGGTVKLLPSSEAAQEYITARVSDGVPPDRLLLFNAEATPFGVAYQPIVTIGTDGPKHAMPGAQPPAPAAKNGASGAANGASAAPEAQASARGTAAGSSAEPAAAATASGPAGTPDGVRMSSQFRPA
jgi:hypothetical protein